jgi:hypothetical protein
MIVKQPSRVTFLSLALREDVLQLRAMKMGEAPMSIRRRARLMRKRPIAPKVVKTTKSFELLSL